MKKLFVISFLATFVIAGCSSTTLTKGIDTFFSDVKAGNIQAAYTETAKEFQAATSLDQFTSFLKQSTLGTYKSASWENEVLSWDQWKIQGEVTTIEGKILPLNISLIQEDGARKIYNMIIPQGENTTTGTAVVPSQSEMTALVHKYMGLFVAAINTWDFTTFYNNIAKIRQTQTTVKDLLTSFKVFVDHKVDLSFTKTAIPTFTAGPSIDTNGIMTVQGTFTTGTGAVVFEDKFFQENNEWKLFGLSIEME